ncbi:MAG: hypothetical protein QGH94_13380 [Phycisphaerae bacterium]|jgi:hypothetical protein|nr:hypothetical protein [Phycisphaerae bacterium]MDP7288972.1 hypothetical protein [Phycisphaerae bacterium]
MQKAAYGYRSGISAIVFASILICTHGAPSIVDITTIKPIAKTLT